MSAPTYTLGGKGHTILRRLAQDEATFPELLDALGIAADDERTAAKVRRVIGAMTNSGFIYRTRVGAIYQIRGLGRDALEELDARATGAVAVPSVRFFARAAA